MNKEIQMNDDFITVIPSQHANNSQQKRIVISTLYFWHCNSFHHRINDLTIHQFLLHVKMFGATVFPENPEKGCLAIDGGKQYKPGEAPVSEIHYKGQLIYCRS